MHLVEEFASASASIRSEPLVHLLNKERIVHSGRSIGTPFRDSKGLSVCLCELTPPAIINQQNSRHAHAHENRTYASMPRGPPQLSRATRVESQLAAVLFGHQS